MGARKERVSLAMTNEERERLKDAAARKGVSVAEYCRVAIDREMAEDEGEEAPRPHYDIEGLIALRKQIFGDRVLPTDSAEMIREAREERTRHLMSLSRKDSESRLNSGPCDTQET